MWKIPNPKVSGRKLELIALGFGIFLPLVLSFWTLGFFFFWYFSHLGFGIFSRFGAFSFGHLNPH